MTTGPSPAVVAIGGGHGLSASLRALRTFAGSLTAVVSVADDGGSTGRLREMRERPAPGDLRKSLVALARHDSLLTRAFEHRFGEGDLEGHAFGNLLIAAFEEVCGDLVTALDEAGVLVDAVGRVLPATREPVRLVGTDGEGNEVVGQVAVNSTVGIRSVALDPVDPPAPADAVTAIRTADLVVLGPGSLYTSVLAATAVPAIRAAVAEAAGRLVYVCNLMPQAVETAGYALVDHVDALRRHGLCPAHVLYDPRRLDDSVPVEGAVAAALADDSGTVHDSDRLAAALQALL